MSATRSFWGQFGLVVGVALAVRLAAAVVIDRQVARTPGRICLIEGDASGYWELGRRIAHGEDFVLYDPPRFVLRMPGFPAVLGVSQLFFGANLFAARCLLAMIGALGCGFVYGLGRVLANPAVALIAGLATALSPPLIAFSPLLLSETSFAAALTANLGTIAILWRKTPDGVRSWWLPIGIGVTGAIATYIRPTWLPIVPLVAVAHLIVARHYPRRWTEAVMMVIALGICLSPW
ncbi:MAG TPA: glycosyltransferase family 39 protein, partial [Planctomycetaceae bacterium]|nr:glycosyltransferase family 39 protein [Planctomycetaceae bacterium]